MSWFGAWAGAWIQGWSGSIAGGLPSNAGPSWANPMSLSFRQGMLSPPIGVRMFRAAGFINFSSYTAIAFRMVGQGVAISGTATGDALGALVYDWAFGDLTVPGNYAAVFTGVDATGRTETFPTGANLEIVVVPAI